MPAEQLPDVKLSDELRQEIEHYLALEIRRSKNDRKAEEKDWIKIQELYEKYELEQKKNFPFEGAAHIMLPITATYTERMQSRLHRTIWRPRYPVSIKSEKKEFSDAVIPTRDYSDWMIREELDLRNVTNGMFMELCKLGTMVSKTIYDRKIETRFSFEPDNPEDPSAGGQWIPVPEILHEGPRVVHVPLPDFFWPQHARWLSEAEWLAHRVRLHWNELVRRERAGVFENIDAVKGVPAQLDDYEQALLKARGKSQEQFTDHYTIYEVWFEYPVPVQGENREKPLAKKLVASFHLESETLLRIKHNWYPEQMHPFDICPYIVRENSITGVGIGQMALPFQIEVSTMHNQRLDNATVMNSIQYKYRADSRVGPDVTVRPVGGIPVDEMDDMEVFQWGQKYDSTSQEEELTMSYLKERVGVPELNLKDQVNVTNYLSLLQESAGKSDMVVDNIRRWMASVIEKCLLLTSQYYPEGRAFTVLGEEGEAVERTFKIGPKAIKKGLSISVTAKHSISSQELERQGKLSVFNVLTQHYGQLTQYFIQSQNPQLPTPVRMVMLEIVNGLSTYVLELLDDFNIRNRDELAINVERIMQLAAAQAATGASAPGAPNGGVQATPGAPTQGGGQARQANQAGAQR